MSSIKQLSSVPSIAAHSDAKAANRVTWIDYAKGFLIVLMVYGHTVGGLVNAGVIPADNIFNQITLWLYAFHMPAFFFISGIFLFQSARRSLKEFVVNKFNTIAYPYLLWTLIQFIILLAVPEATNSYEPHMLPYLLLFDPIMQFWFLHALFICYMIMIVAHKVFKLNERGFMVLAIVLHLIVVGLMQAGVALPWFIHKPLFEILFLAAGAYFSGRVRTLFTDMPSLQLVLLAIVSFAAMSAVYVIFQEAYALFNYWQTITATLGIVGTLAIAVLISRLNWRFFHYLGQYTLQIYVAHIIFASGLRIVLDRFLGIQDLLLHLTLGIIVGIAAPLVLNWVSNRLRFRYLFSLG
jgi:fucose 4-O-acetylase-like acetyltransferase